jgi:hypothetical protein
MDERLDSAASFAGLTPKSRPSEYREFDRVMVPTRRGYVRNSDGSPVRDSVSITIDVTDVTFT